MKLNLTKLIFIVCFSAISFVSINFITCNFMIPRTMNRENVKGELKNPPPLDCKESEKKRLRDPLNDSNYSNCIKDTS